MIIGITGNALDIDDVKTERQERKRNQHGKTQIKFSLTIGHVPNIASHQTIETSSTAQFEIPKKAKTRAERRSEDDEEEQNKPSEISFHKASTQNELLGCSRHSTNQSFAAAETTGNRGSILGSGR